MSVKMIINADDFGPIDFINQGVYHHLKAGNLDSTQVLVNMDQDVLKKNLATLHGYVPESTVFDLGVHFTLTSGAPMTGKNNPGRLWGKMIDENKDGSVQFKKYQKFYFGYATYLEAIRNEFRVQRDSLLKLVDEVNTEKGETKLQVTSASNHHNLFTIAPDLFDVYFSVSQEKGLKIRSPKAMPYKVMNQYYEYILPLFNLSDSKEQRHLMADMNNNFAENYFTDKEEKNVPSPAYIDIEFYKGVGSLGIGKVTKNKISNRKEAFDEVVSRAKAYTPDTNVEPSPAIVEVVFHLGAPTAESIGMKYKDMVEGYPGITHKYFDNRETEVAALTELSSIYADLIKTRVSWNECGVVTYRKKG